MGTAVRYLTTSAAACALRRGKKIEQLLGAFEDGGRRGLRYACVWPATRFRDLVVRLHLVADLEQPGLPVDEYPAFYEADEDEDRLVPSRRPTQRRLPLLWLSAR